MNEPIPLHRHGDISDSGIHLKFVTGDDMSHHPVEYAHRDDYYIFGIITHGSLNCDIDFKTYTISSGQIQFIRPGQVHRFISGTDFEGLMLMVESGLVSDTYKLIFEEASVNGISAEISDSEVAEFQSLFTIISMHLDNTHDTLAVRNLISAYVGLFAGCFRRLRSEHSGYSCRQMEIVLQLNSQLHTHIAESHAPKFYADKLHISPIYLNEVVKKVTGRNVSTYIRDEIVLRAKRLLYHTDMPVKEIALTLGFDDHAYFTRLFTKATGKSPVKFRLKP